MEWQGINLSDYHERKWLRNAICNLSSVVIVIFIAITIATLLWHKNQQLNQQDQQLRQTISTIERQLKTTQQNIQQLKATPRTTKPIYLTKQNVVQFIAYLKALNIQGFIDSVQLYIENAPQIKLNGKFTEENELNTLVQQLKQLNYGYKIDYFQKNDQQQFEFSLLITLKPQEQKNEKMDH